MNDALPVRVVDGVADLAGKIEAAVQLERAGGGDQILQRLAMDVFHDDEEDVVLLLGGGYRDDVGMTDAGEQPRFTQQVAEVHALAMRYFDRDLFVDPRVLREIHGAEPAAAERRQDLVLAEGLAFEQQSNAEW